MITPFATLPLSAAAPKQAGIACLETRPVLDAVSADAALPQRLVQAGKTACELAKKIILDGMSARQAMEACGFAKYSFRLNGKIANQAHWFSQNFGLRSDLPGRTLNTTLSVLAGPEPDAETTIAYRYFRGLSEENYELPALGRTRFNIITPTGEFIHRGGETLYMGGASQAHFVEELRAGLYTGAANVLCVTGVSNRRNLNVIGDIQRAAREQELKLVVDAKDVDKKDGQANLSLTAYFRNASVFEGTGKIALAKPNLKEFCALARTFLGASLDERDLEWFQRNGNLAEFEARILPIARRLADLCMIENSGQLILTCGEHPFYVVTSGNPDVLRVTPPKIAAVSPVGAGDSTLAMAALFLAFGTMIGPDQARFLAASGAATAELPGAELGTLNRIFQLANDFSENGIKVETIGIPSVS